MWWANQEIQEPQLLNLHHYQLPFPFLSACGPQFARTCVLLSCRCERYVCSHTYRSLIWTPAHGFFTRPRLPSPSRLLLLQLPLPKRPQPIVYSLSNRVRFSLLSVCKPILSVFQTLTLVSSVIFIAQSSSALEMSSRTLPWRKSWMQNPTGQLLFVTPSANKSLRSAPDSASHLSLSTSLWPSPTLL